MMIKFKQHQYRRNIQGFTLLEIVIALFILSILALVAISSLQPVLRTQQQSKIYLERLEQLQMAYVQMQRDFAQMMFPPILSLSGDGIEFSANGFINPLSLENRSTLQQINYALQGNQLVRSTQQTDAQGPYSEISSKVLLDNISIFNIEPFYSEPVFINELSQIPINLGVSIVLENQQTLYWLFTVEGKGFNELPI